MHIKWKIENYKNMREKYSADGDEEGFLCPKCGAKVLFEYEISLLSGKKVKKVPITCKNCKTEWCVLL